MAAIDSFIDCNDHSYTGGSYFDEALSIGWIGGINLHQWVCELCIGVCVLPIYGGFFRFMDINQKADSVFGPAFRRGCGLFTGAICFWIC